MSGAGGLRLPFVPALPIRTERLQLRSFRPDDADALLAIQSSPDVARYVPWEPRSSDMMPGVVARKVAGTALRADGDHVDLAVTLVDGGRLIGDVLILLTSVEHETAEVGFVFDPEHQGQGYATEAVRAALRLAFEEAGARRVIARTDARNVRSRRLCARLGMRLEAELVENEWFKGGWCSETDYALLAREWSALRTKAAGEQHPS